jgi:hypothetical protein
MGNDPFSCCLLLKSLEKINSYIINYSLPYSIVVISYVHMTNNSMDVEIDTNRKEEEKDGGRIDGLMDRPTNGQVDAPGNLIPGLFNNAV